jgi:hypothetical protein
LEPEREDFMMVILFNTLASQKSRVVLAGNPGRRGGFVGWRFRIRDLLAKPEA